MAIVLFLDARCSACADLVAAIEEGHVAELSAPLIVVSDEVEAARRLRRSADATVLVDAERSIANVFKNTISPHVFVVDEYGVVVATGTPNRWNELESLVATSRRGGDWGSHRQEAAVGS